LGIRVGGGSWALVLFAAEQCPAVRVVVIGFLEQTHGGQIEGVDESRSENVRAREKKRDEQKEVERNVQCETPSGELDVETAA
jgi:hypothetical protein